MLANYGYSDGSGAYFITIDTNRCATCADRPCVAACPAEVLEIIVDDYDDEVCAVREEHRKSVKYSCAPCKPASDRAALPCTSACPAEALTHSW